MVVRFLSLFFFCFISSLSAQEKWDDSNFENLPTQLEQRHLGSVLEDKIPATVNFDHYIPALSSECEPLATVGDCINVISGQFFQVDKDLKGTTIDPLDLVRFYDSGSNAESFLGFGFGSGFPLWASEMEAGARHQYGLISERENFMLLYRTKEKRSTKSCVVDPRVLEKGYTNLCRARVSGKNNIVNRNVLYRSKKHPNKGWTMKFADGSKRIYSKRVALNQSFRAKMAFPTEEAYLLEKEVKSNGNQLHFCYQEIDGKTLLKKIETLNRSGKHVLNRLHFEYENGGWTVQDGCGHSATYRQEEKLRSYSTSLGVRFKMGNFLDSANSTLTGKVDYTLYPFNWKMARIDQPNEQSLWIEYYPSGKVKTVLASKGSRKAVPIYTETISKFGF